MERPLSRYSTVAIVLHWTIAALLATNVVLAWVFENVNRHGALRPYLLGWHRSFGLTVLFLTLLRLVWRLTHRPPPYPPGPSWQRAAAHVVHWAFYGVLLGLPLTGWVMSSIGKRPIVLYGAVPWPKIAYVQHLPEPVRRVWDDNFGEAHQLLARLTYVLLAVHVAAALHHHFVARDGLLHRMGVGSVGSGSRRG